MKYKRDNKVECELSCKATASLTNSVIKDLSKKDKDLLDLLKDDEQNELEDKPKPVD